MVKKKNQDLFADNFNLDQFSKKRLRLGSERRQWTEEVFLNQKTDFKEAVGHNFNSVYGRIFSRASLVIFLILIVRIAWLQIYKGDYYYSLAEGNRLRLERLEARRGIIYDRQHQPLVQNIASFLVYITPANLPDQADDRQLVLSRLANILGDQILEKIEAELTTIKPRSLESYQPIFISDQLTHEQAVQLIVQTHQLPGVSLTNRYKRQYVSLDQWLSSDDSVTVNGLNSLSLILGYIGKISDSELTRVKDQDYLAIDYIGKTGLEAFYEEELRGVNGSKQVEVDAFGNEKKKISQQNASDGQHLILNIDGQIQTQLELIVRQHLIKNKKTRAAAVVLNPNNGAILALVNQPSFDNNNFSGGISQMEYDQLVNNPDKPMFNRVISGEYPSGSTVKMVVAAAALQEKIINQASGFLSTGGLRIGQWSFPDWKAGGHGWTTVTKAIAESVNTFFYYIGGGYENFDGLGLERLTSYFRQLGLGQASGIDIYGEAQGLVPTASWKENKVNETWYIGDTYHLSIGQGYLLTTPLQVANYTAFFANGGKIYQPQLVKEILNNDESINQVISPKVIIEKVIDPDYVEIVKQGLRQTVISGSAQSLKTLPVAVAGKTGTAQFDSRKSAHSWFTGFAPYDQPEIVMTVLVEEGGESNDLAVPIAKDFWQWYFQDLDTPIGYSVE